MMTEKIIVDIFMCKNSLFRLVVILSILSGCVIGPIRDIREWIGYSADDVVRIWGAPSSSYQFQNGDMLLQYTESRIDAYPSSSYNRKVKECDWKFKNCKDKEELVIEPNISNIQCKTIFTISKMRVVNIAQEGDCFGFNIKYPPYNGISMQQNMVVNDYCREANTTIIIDGKAERAYDQRCFQPDGTWRR